MNTQKVLIAFIFFPIGFLCSCQAGLNSEDVEQRNSDKIFMGLYNLTQGEGDLVGAAWSGNMNGESHSAFLVNSNNDKIIFYKYNLLNLVSGSIDFAEETYLIKSLQRKNNELFSMPVTNSDKYYKHYISGKLVGLKASINGGPIEDFVTVRNIFIALDLENKSLLVSNYAGNSAMEGHLELRPNQVQLLMAILGGDPLKGYPSLDGNADSQREWSSQNSRRGTKKSLDKEELLERLKSALDLATNNKIQFLMENTSWGGAIYECEYLEQFFFKVKSSSLKGSVRYSSKMSEVVHKIYGQSKVYPAMAREMSLSDEFNDKALELPIFTVISFRSGNEFSQFIEQYSRKKIFSDYILTNESERTVFMVSQ